MFVRRGVLGLALGGLVGVAQAHVNCNWLLSWGDWTKSVAQKEDGGLSQLRESLVRLDVDPRYADFTRVQYLIERASEKELIQLAKYYFSKPATRGLEREFITLMERLGPGHAAFNDFDVILAQRHFRGAKKIFAAFARFATPAQMGRVTAKARMVGNITANEMTVLMRAVAAPTQLDREHLIYSYFMPLEGPRDEGRDDRVRQNMERVFRSP